MPLEMEEIAMLMRKQIFSVIFAISALMVALIAPSQAYAQAPVQDPSRCAPQMMAAPLGDPSVGPHWNGWSPTPANTRFQPADQAGLAAGQVPNLKLKWAF